MCREVRENNTRSPGSSHHGATCSLHRNRFRRNGFRAGEFFQALILGSLLCLVSAGEARATDGAPRAHGAQSTNDFHTLAYPGEVHWGWPELGKGIGNELLEVTDVDGKPGQEIVVAAAEISGSYNRSSHLYVLNADATKASCILPLPSERIRSSRLRRESPGDDAEMVIASLDRVYRVNLTRCEVLQHDYLPADLQSVNVGDFPLTDGLGIAYSDGQDLYLAPLNELSSPILLSGLGGIELASGRLSATSHDDIVVLGNSIRVISGASGNVLDTFPDDDYTDIEVGNLIAGGSGEIVAKRRWRNSFTVFTLNEEQPIFERQLERLSEIRVLDPDRDGLDEIVYADDGWPGEVGFINGQGVVEHSMPSPQEGITNFAVMEIPGGAPQLLMGTRQGGTFDDHLYGQSLTSSSFDWKTPDIEGPMQVEPVGSGRLAMTVQSKDDFVLEGGARVFSLSTGEIMTDLESSADEPISSGWSIAASLTNEADGTGTICFSGSWSVKCFDSETYELIWGRAKDGGDSIFASIDDFDGNGTNELLILTESGIVRTYDITTGFLGWQSPQLKALEGSIDIGFDGVAKVGSEIWIVTADGVLVRLDAGTGDTIETNLQSPITAIEATGEGLLAARAGVGVGLIDTSDYSISRLLYETTENVSILEASRDGAVALIGVGARPNCEISLVPLKGAFEPWEIGPFPLLDEHITDSGQLILVSRYGVLTLSLEKIDRIFRDQFD